MVLEACSLTTQTSWAPYVPRLRIQPVRLPAGETRDTPIPAVATVPLSRVATAVADWIDTTAPAVNWLWAYHKLVLESQINSLDDKPSMGEQLAESATLAVAGVVLNVRLLPCAA